MGAPYRYRRECGPGALAAVTGLDVDRAAGLLWRARPLWNRTGRTSGGSLTFGTPVTAVVDVLLRLGAGVETYDQDGVLRADVTMTPELLAGWTHDRVRSPVRRTQRPRERPETGTEGQDTEDGLETVDRSVGTPLSAWMDLRAAGYWIYTVEDEAEAHLLAAWGGTVLAGGPLEEYESWNVRKALRVFPPDTSTEGRTCLT